MMFESEGSNAIDVTAIFAMKSSSAAQLAPLSVVFQMPPATPAAYMMFGELGSMISARVRPPTLPGPSDCHVPRTPRVAPRSAAEGLSKFDFDMPLSVDETSTLGSPVSCWDPMTL